MTLQCKPRPEGRPRGYDSSDVSGEGHGGKTVQEKTIFIATNKRQYHPANPALDGDVYRLLPQTYVADVILDYLGIKLAAKGCAEDDLLCIHRRTGPLSLDVLQFNIWQEGTVVKGGYDSSTWEPLDVWPTDHKALLSRFELILDWDNVPGKSDNR